MGNLSRLPCSNEAPVQQENPWGSQNPCFDNTAVLLNNLGKRCCVCERVIFNEYLSVKDGKNYCPDHAKREMRGYIIFISPVNFPVFAQGREVKQQVHYTWNLEIGDKLKWGYSNLSGIAEVVSKTGGPDAGYGRVFVFKKVS
jgi:hypothetical protein